jgi:adenosylhomocysteine nucleosidase
MVDRVAVLAPMVSELRPVVRAFGLTPAGSAEDPKRHEGHAGDLEIIATMTGIGMGPAAETVARVLETEKVDHVMVVGIAGGVGATIQVGDVLVPEVVVDGPSGAEYRPAALPGILRRGRLVSSDDFQVEPEELASLEAAGVIALDTETAAVAAVCERRGCEWSVVRAISDMANDHPIGDDVMSLAKPDGSANIPGFLKYAAAHPGKVPQLMKLGRDSQRAANLAAKHAAAAAAQLTR